MEPEIPREGQLWLGAITVVSWILFTWGHVSCEHQKRQEAELRRTIGEALDHDYLLPFRPGRER